MATRKHNKKHNALTKKRHYKRHKRPHNNRKMNQTLKALNLPQDSMSQPSELERNTRWPAGWAAESLQNKSRKNREKSASNI